VIESTGSSQPDWDAVAAMRLGQPEARWARAAAPVHGGV